MADVIISTLTTIGGARFAYTLFIDDSDAGSHDDVVLPVMLPVTGVLALTFLSSTVYGFYERSRCKRMQEEEQRAADVTAVAVQATEGVRADVVGDRPMFCLLEAAGVGACYADEPSCAVAAAHQSGTCETRAEAWCFDHRGIADARGQTICSVTPADCETRRTRVTADRTNIVTTCGAYRARP